MLVSHGNFRGVRAANVKREVIDGQVDIEPQLTDGSPLRSYAYCAVRTSPKGEFLDRVCVGRSPKEVEEIVARERETNPVFDRENPVTRTAKVTITEG